MTFSFLDNIVKSNFAIDSNLIADLSSCAKTLVNDDFEDYPLILDNLYYYDGEDDIRDDVEDNKTEYWYYEKEWATLISNKDNHSALSEIVIHYLHNGLLTLNEHMITPTTLKAYLFYKYTHVLGHAIDKFGFWLMSNYPRYGYCNADRRGPTESISQ